MKTVVAVFHTPSTVSMKFCPSPVKVRVWLFGGGEPTYGDISRFSFHDPISGSTPCPNAGLATIKQAIASLLIMIFPFIVSRILKRNGMSDRLHRCLRQ
jgi:hypothetical protein